MRVGRLPEEQDYGGAEVGAVPGNAANSLDPTQFPSTTSINYKKSSVNWRQGVVLAGYGLVTRR